MSTSKPKPSATKASPSASATRRAATGPTPASARSSGAEQSPSPHDAKAPRAEGGGVRPTLHEDRLLQALGPIAEVDIADVGARLSEMIESAAAGRTHLIRSGTGANAPLVVLIGVSELKRVLREPTEPVPSGRTMGELLDSLPYSGMNLPALRAEPLGNDGLPEVRLPK